MWVQNKKERGVGLARGWEFGCRGSLACVVRWGALTGSLAELGHAQGAGPPAQQAQQRVSTAGSWRGSAVGLARLVEQVQRKPK